MLTPASLASHRRRLTGQVFFPTREPTFQKYITVHIYATALQLLFSCHPMLRIVILFVIVMSW
jgi:hypothetical protein